MEQPESTAEFTPGSSFSMDDPVQYALSIHLVLRCIFTQFGKRKDLSSLLAVRAVCSLWWIEALDILHDFVHLLPYIAPRGGFEPGKNLNEFAEIIKPSDALPIGGIPLKLIVTEWTPQVVRFLKERAMDIVLLDLRIPNSDGFSLGQESFHLNNLRFAKFWYSRGQDDGADSYHSQRFQDALTLFLNLIKDAPHLEKCEVLLLDASVGTNYQVELKHLPRNLTHLGAPVEDIENMALFQTWPRLHSLRLYLRPGNSLASSPCITEAASRLTSLKLDMATGEFRQDALPFYELPVLPKLTELELNDIGIRGDLPLPVLLPQLTTVRMARWFCPQDILASLVRMDFCYPNVTDFSLAELLGPLENVDHVTRFTVFTKSFPNLVKLSIESADFNIAATAPIIFSSLKRLKYLKLYSFGPRRMVYDVVQLITGVSRDQIPEDESTWPDSLAASPNAITKLTDLQEFKLTLRNERIITQRESRFIFRAAFLRMINLKLIHFTVSVRFAYLGNEVQAEWEAGGRVIKYRPSIDDNENGALQDERDNEQLGDDDENWIFGEESDNEEGEESNHEEGEEIDNEEDEESDNQEDEESDNEEGEESDNEGRDEDE